MTVPVIPGPFSFLQSAGQAAGAIATEKKSQEEKEFEKIWKGVTTTLGSVQAGLLSPDVLDDPTFQQQAASVGLNLGSASAALKNREALAKNRSAVVRNLFGGDVTLPGGLGTAAGTPDVTGKVPGTATPRQRRVAAATGKVPTTADVVGEQIAERQQDVLTGDGARADLAAGIPTEAAVVAQQFDTKQKLGLQAAGSKYTDLEFKRLPTTQEAWEHALKDRQLAPLIESGELTRGYVDRGVLSLWQDEQTRKLASARVGAISRQGLITFANINLDNLTQQRRDKVTELKGILARSVTGSKAGITGLRMAAKSLPEEAKLFEEYEDVQRTIEDLDGAITFWNTEIENEIGRKFGPTRPTEEPPPPPPPPSNGASVDAKAVEIFTRLLISGGPNGETYSVGDLNKAVEAGEINSDTRDAIIDNISRSFKEGVSQ
jgi:hypothetical protein